MGSATYFLGVELDRHSLGIHLHQHKYILNLFNDVGLMGARSTTTPLPKGLNVTPFIMETSTQDPSPTIGYSKVYSLAYS